MTHANLGRGLATALLLTFSLTVAAAPGRCPNSNDGTPGIAVKDRERGVLPVYRHQGESYLEGISGNRYEILLCNPTSQRVLAVVSVDGVNVISGETAGTQQRGYVLGPYQTMLVAGFRKSEQEVAAFYFTGISNSYAARTGRPDNVGVIGAAFFREVLPEPRMKPQMSEAAPAAPMRDQARSAAGAAAPAGGSGQEAKATTDSSLRMMPREEKLGTGHGERIESASRTVTFQREDAAFQIVTLRYESRVRLETMGVIRKPLPPPVSPQPFPNDSFVPDPPPRRY